MHRSKRGLQPESGKIDAHQRVSAWAHERSECVGVLERKPAFSGASGALMHRTEKCAQFSDKSDVRAKASAYGAVGAKISARHSRAGSNSKDRHELVFLLRAPRYRDAREAVCGASHRKMCGLFCPDASGKRRRAEAVGAACKLQPDLGPLAVIAGQKNGVVWALNPDNGELVWHYQTVPGEQWDYTATQQMILADLDFDKEVMLVGTTDGPVEGDPGTLHATDEEVRYPSLVLRAELARPVDAAHAKHGARDSVAACVVEHILIGRALRAAVGGGKERNDGVRAVVRRAAVALRAYVGVVGGEAGSRL